MVVGLRRRHASAKSVRDTLFQSTRPEGAIPTKVRKTTSGRVPVAKATSGYQAWCRTRRRGYGRVRACAGKAEGAAGHPLAGQRGQESVRRRLWRPARPHPQHPLTGRQGVRYRAPPRRCRRARHRGLPSSPASMPSQTRPPIICAQERRSLVSARLLEASAQRRLLLLEQRQDRLQSRTSTARIWNENNTKNA
jgi:hypothetical protein